MYELARPAIYSYSIQRGTPHVNLRQKRASLFNSQILVVALIGIFGGLKPKMCVHFSKDWRSDLSAHLRTSPHLYFVRLKSKVIMRLLPNRVPHHYGTRSNQQKPVTYNPRLGHWLSVDVNIMEIG